MRSAYDAAYQHNRTTERRYPSEFDDSNQSYRTGSDRSYQPSNTSHSSNSGKQQHNGHRPEREGQAKDATTTYFGHRKMQASPTNSPTTSPIMNPSSSVSTINSEQDQLEEEDEPEFDIQHYAARSSGASALVPSPSEFSELFPSSRQLRIRHDDSTFDGNMNLRVDTGVTIDGRRYDMTLFHLRMHDLKDREFSLRRYCRDSGREVCHSARKHQKSEAEKRPAFQRSLSSALQSMRPKPERQSSAAPTLASLKRNDSGYSSMHSTDFEQGDHSLPASQGAEAALTDTVKLEFSNYAQVEVKRAGGKGKGNKRYEFQYWGVNYTWKRVVTKGGNDRQVKFHLTRPGSDRACARIDPVQLDARQAHEERKSGGWIPPCTMSITDATIVHSGKDVADTVVAAGLIALVDDTIRNHFDSEDTKQQLPKFGIEYVGPKRLISEMFSRKETSSGEASRPSSSAGPPSSAASVTGSRRPTTSSRQSSRDYR